MATHAIPPGSVNFAVNMPQELRRAAGRLAAMEGRPLGAYIRELVAGRVAVARQAGRLAVDTARQLVLPLGVAVVLLGVAAVTAASVLGENEPRRAPRTARRRDEVGDGEIGGAA